MKKWIVTCALLTMGSMAFAQVNTLTKKEKKDGFQLLFDGKTLEGWHTYNKPGFTGNCWSVVDGVISFDVTKKERDALAKRSQVLEEQVQQLAPRVPKE